MFFCKSAHLKAPTWKHQISGTGFVGRFLFVATKNFGNNKFQLLQTWAFPRRSKLASPSPTPTRRFQTQQIWPNQAIICCHWRQFKILPIRWSQLTLENCFFFNYQLNCTHTHTPFVLSAGMWSLNFFKVITGSTFSAKVAFVAYRNRSFGPWTLLTDSICAIGSINSHYFHITGDRQYKEFRPEHIYTFIIHMYIYIYIYIYVRAPWRISQCISVKLRPKKCLADWGSLWSNIGSHIWPLSFFFGAEISCKTAQCQANLWTESPSICWRKGLWIFRTAFVHLLDYLEQEHHCSDCSYSPNGTRVHFSISVILCVYVPFQCLHCPKSIILPFAFRLYHPTSDIRCKTFRIDHETVATRSACCQPSPGRANVASPTRKKQTTQPTVDGRNPKQPPGMYKTF